MRVLAFTADIITALFGAGLVCLGLFGTVDVERFPGAAHVGLAALGCLLTWRGITADLPRVSP